MKEKFHTWMQIAGAFANLPAADVKCPDCKGGPLMVKDEPLAGMEEVDRYIICNACGAYAVLSRFKKPDRRPGCGGEPALPR